MTKQLDPLNYILISFITKTFLLPFKKKKCQHSPGILFIDKAYSYNLVTLSFNKKKTREKMF